MLNVRYHFVAIAINKYQHRHLKPLCGCVNDAKLMQSCLKELCGEPMSKAHLLFDEHATRANIVSLLREQLVDDPNLHKDDLIVICYAGHGGIAKVVGRGETTVVETLCPVDEGVNGTLCIPDFTIHALLRNLARAKGNNIVFICDCCHSGGIARGGDDEGARLQPRTRASKIPSVPHDTDAEILASLNCQGSERSGFCANDDDFLFLAACGKSEIAYEDRVNRSGRFTQALVSRLRTLNREKRLAETSYSNLVQQLKIPNQTPEVCGRFADRMLFDTRVSGWRFPVEMSGDKIATICAGEIHGVVKGTMFSTSTGASMKCFEVRSMTAQAAVVNGALDRPTWATVSSWNAGELSVFQRNAEGVALSESFLPVSAIQTSYRLRLVTSINAANVVACRGTSDVSFAVVTAGKQRWMAVPALLGSLGRRFSAEIRVPRTPNSIADALTKLAHFKYQLEAGVGTGDSAFANSDIELRMYRMSQPEGCSQWVRDSENCFDRQGRAWLDLQQGASCRVGLLSCIHLLSEPKRQTSTQMGHFSSAAVVQAMA
uniref:Peptidase C14 caspase domain-containing protein n=1 Tax=Mycena chlorophos TaxID=658473 RepID=A0ABQ0LA33_MYCCL|nr:predicted protein [Mycena chlorophos]